MIIVTAQTIFDAYLKHLDQFIKESVQNKEQSLIMAEALMLKTKELFISQGFGEDQALLFVEHALQELNNNKPTIH